MHDLMAHSYGFDTTTMISFGEIYYVDHGNSFTYMIPVGKEKNTIFFHLLKFIDTSPHFKHIFTIDHQPTLQVRDSHYYCLFSRLKLHQTITESQLNVPVIYSERYPLAAHFKSKWEKKNQIHEDNLNLALDKTPAFMRSVLFDLATYYIHLNEEAYRLLKPVEQTLFSTSICHVRIKPDTPLYQFFMPDYLILDNRSRNICEYLRHLFLETGDLDKIGQLVAHMAHHDPMLEVEWQFLYARLYFPTHFYDMVYDVIINDDVKIDELYDQTMNYSQLLAMLPKWVKLYTGYQLDVPLWAETDTIL